jgi:uncharacterized membrane protein YfcA
MFSHALTLPPTFWLIAVAAIILVGMSKAGFGGTATNLGVPLMAIVVAPPFAAAVMLPILLVLDAIGLFVFRGKADGPNLRIILPGAIIGIALGWLTFDYIDPRWIRVLIGIEAVVFAIDRMLELRGGMAPVAATSPTVRRGIFWGALSGFTSFVSHAGATALFFAVVNFLKLFPYAHLGLLDLSNLEVSVLLLPAVPVGYFIGYRLMHAIDMRQFNLITAGMLLLAGFKLIWDGVAK